MKQHWFAGVLWLWVATTHAGVNVWTHHNDNSRTGANLAETQLTTANVNSAQFGKLWDYEVDEQIYAQPLVVQGVAIPGLGVHDVVFVATMNNTVYAFDANDNAAGNIAPLWQTNFNDPAAKVIAVPSAPLVGASTNIDPLTPIGILSTPVIDTATHTLYVLANTSENGTVVQHLHALDIGTGAERSGSPTEIKASVSGNGYGYDSSNGVLNFKPNLQNGRAALGLANGMVLVAWASYSDINPYHGWVMAYDAATLAQVGVFNTTPNGTKGGIWQSGDGPALDGNGNAYYTVGNGSYDGVTNFGQSVLELNYLNGIVLKDWFTPDDYATQSSADQDFGVSGPMLIPGTSLVINGSKAGILYLMSTAAMGHMKSGNNQIPQLLKASGGHLHGSPAYYPYGSTGPMIYVWGENDFLKGYRFNGATLDPTPLTRSSYTAPPGMPGGFLSISANGNQPGTAILWVNMTLSGSAEHQTVPGVLRAFDATNLGKELWNTEQVTARDSIGLFAKFSPPTVANGRVYQATFSNKLRVYGLFASQAPAPTGTLSAAKSSASGAINLTSAGTSDWVHWPAFDHKLSGNGQITDFVAVYPPYNVSTYTNDRRVYSWSDGTPTLASSVAAGVTISGIRGGFRFSAPADRTSRTLTVYLGGTNSSGKLRAYLSDGSAADIIDATAVVTGTYYTTYSFTYSSGAPAQTLNVEWTQTSSSGSVSLAGATLAGGGAAPAAPSSAPASVTASRGTSPTSVTVNWTAVSGASGYALYRSTTSGVLGNLLGTSQQALFTDSSVTPGVNYYYSVAGTNSGGTGPVSAQAMGFASSGSGTTPPATPTGLAATQGTSTNSVTVSWTAVSAAAGYTIYRSTTLGTQGSALGTSSSAGFTDTTATAGVTYWYSVVATNSAGASAASAQVSGFAAAVSAGGGSLVGSSNSSTTPVNLTTVGSADWAHWPEFTEKATGRAQISNYTLTSGGSAHPYTDSPLTLSWTDGTPAVSGSAHSGLYLGGVGRGFRITVPADTTPRQLTLYLGGYLSTGQLTASLSDSSAPTFTDASHSSTTGQYLATYVLNYSAARAGQVLTITWVNTAGSSGNVTISGAVLSGGGTTVAPPATPTGLAATQGTSTNSVTVSWTAVSAAAGYTIYRSTTLGTQGSALGTSSSAGFTDTTATAGVTYWYSVVATNSAGASAASAQVSGFAAAASAGGGSLVGSSNSSTTPVNLTTVGSADWAHWPEFTEKATGRAQISNYTLTSGGSAHPYTDSPLTLSWTDGTPAVSGSAHSGLYLGGVGRGFRITVPADTTPRQLTLYLGGYLSTGQLTASLSDSSAPTFTDASHSSTTGQYLATYVLNYSAARAGQVLTITWVNTAGSSGNVTISGAALQ